MVPQEQQWSKYEVLNMQLEVRLAFRIRFRILCVPQQCDNMHVADFCEFENEFEMQVELGVASSEPHISTINCGSCGTIGVLGNNLVALLYQKHIKNRKARKHGSS